MKHTPTIRAELDRYLQQEGLNFARFGQISGMNRGAVSAIVSGNKPISINQLDQITEAMGLPEGHFYDLFIENFIIDHPPNMRRIEPFLYRCVELDKLDTIRKVVGVIMDNLLYSSKLFEIAEDLFAQGQHEAALILYENVAEVEKYQHSERLALCQYRIFTLQIGDDQNQNVGVTAVFEAFVERLDEIDQLDALKDLANVYRSLRKWDKVDEMAKKMRAKAEIQYSMKHQANRKFQEQEKKTKGPLFGYIAYADLLCASVCEAQGDYKQALQYTYAYANLDWVKETDEDALRWVNLFKNWAEGNTYVYKLLSGEVSALPDYVDYICTSPDKSEKEMVAKLMNIVMAANQYQIDVDDVLLQFEENINSFAQLPASNDMYTQQVVPDQYARFGYELAYYFLNRGMHSDGFKYLIYATKSSNTLNNVTCFKNCLGLFVHFQAYAIPEIQAEFYNFIEKVWLNNVKKNGSIDRCN
ncbi:tetratricopeptide repeat protein [Paenibacillus farraposensis]|nr:transcriptional regulator [Paenibacillus farraposensis]MCC3380598.1 transcriptional regulator [Paenibacillus farraposensis]